MKSWTIAAIVTACAAPTAALNIWPRVETMISRGVSGNEVGIVILVTMSALGMAAIPFAMRKAENLGFWSVCLLTGISLAVVNYLMAVGAIGKVRDASATEAAAIISKVSLLRGQLEELKASRGSVIPKAVTPSMLKTAREAVQLAISARDQECGKVGDYCRARVAQLSTRQGELADLEAAAADRAAFDANIDRSRGVEAELLRAGPAPSYTDAQATRIAAILGLGGSAAEIERVANGIINLLAITAEAFALLMPRILVTALASPGSPPIRSAALKAAAAPPPKSLPPPSRPTASSRKPDVSLWYDQRIKKAAGNRLKTWDAYLDYKRWAGEQPITAVSFTAFSHEMQQLKVPEEKVMSRSFYRDVDLLARGFRVVA